MERGREDAEIRDAHAMPVPVKRLIKMTKAIHSIIGACVNCLFCIDSAPFPGKGSPTISDHKKWNHTGEHIDV
jgi:hypothetical protein